MTKAPLTGSLFPQGQLRLAALSAFNWGSFHGLHHADIDRDGTLITGDNGAGKSTLVDALTALLSTSGKASFNVAAAQGDRSDRSLLSYVRGSFGKAHDGARTQVLSKRTGATVCGLRACYKADDGSCVTLCGLFWISTASNSLQDLTRLYFVAQRELPLEDILSAFEHGQARGLKAHYKADQSVAVYERFADYQEAYQRLLHLNNANAPALLGRALGLKKIDDLTLLIREFVLEPSTVRDAARKAVAEFDDLVATHKELEDTRRQRDMLAPLAELQKDLQQSAEEQQTLEAQAQGLPTFLARQELDLCDAQLEQLTQACKALTVQLEQHAQAVKDAEGQVEARYADFLQAGGERIESLRKELQQAEARLNATTMAARDYQQSAKALSLDDSLERDVFETNQEQARQAQANFAQRRKKAQDAFGQAAGELSSAQQQLKELQQELAQVEQRPESNIDPRFLDMREAMAQALDFAPEELPFIGELMDVKSAEATWQGAIERALGGLRTTLAVPADRYPQVTAWLNARHLGLHVRAQVVEPRSAPARFYEDGFLRKLKWREHPYRDWLKQHLARHDLHCVDDSEALDKTAFSMTRAGLIHRNQGRFEKKDIRRIDDRRDWCLGFSNARRLASLQQELQQQKDSLAKLQSRTAAHRQALDGVDDNIAHWKKLLACQWDQVDLQRAAEQRQQLAEALQRLESSGGDLATAKAAWEDAKNTREQRQDDYNHCNSQLGGKNTQKQAAQQQREQVAKVAAGELADTVGQQLQARLPKRQTLQLDAMAELRSRLQQAIEAELRGARGRSNAAGQRATSIMGAYRNKEEWQSITAEWGSSLQDLPGYVDRLNYIEAEGLPELVDQFRERLNRHTTHALAGIRQQINNELDDIRDRIDIINRVLVRTEFRQGTHLQIRTRRQDFPHVRRFEQQLGAVLSAVTSEDHEARFTALCDVVEILHKASDPASAHSQESRRLLDPRYRLSFVAEDIDNLSGEVRDVLDSSSGKSGGEKEAFAGTIVAASLAYVLTPDGAEHPVYATVFLDEAFSNTAEAVSRRVLRVFRELHLHVNLLTPFKNLNLARESARSLLIVERDQDKHESWLSQVTWEEIDEHLAARAQIQLDTVNQETHPA